MVAVRSDVAVQETEPPSEHATQSVHQPGFESAIRAEHKGEADAMRMKALGQVPLFASLHAPLLPRDLCARIVNPTYTQVLYYYPTLSLVLVSADSAQQ